jgi:hypothetical protein
MYETCNITNIYAEQNNVLHKDMPNYTLFTKFLTSDALDTKEYVQYNNDVAIAGI